jgi:menaquinone-specific isochorismate synthase
LLSREYTGPLGENGAAPGALWLLAERVSHVLSEARLQSAADPAERIVRLAVPARWLDPFRWLSEQRMFPKVYWSGREDRAGVAAVGIADLRETGVSDGPGSLSKLLASLPDSGVSGARYIGGGRFDPLGKPDEEWAAFGAYRFVLPRFELHDGESETTLVCNLVLPRDTDYASKIVQEIEDLSLPEGASCALLPFPVLRVDSPDLQGWRENVERALAAFSEGRLGKVSVGTWIPRCFWRA